MAEAVRAMCQVPGRGGTGEAVCTEIFGIAVDDNISLEGWLCGHKDVSCGSLGGAAE